MRLLIRVLGCAALLAATTSVQARGAACVSHPAYGNDPYCLLFGDLDGDGQQEPVQYHAGVFAFGAFGNGPVQVGQSGDYPLLGDWNGDGRDTIGLYRDGRWLLTNDASYLVGEPTRLREAFRFGARSDTPVSGDWNGDGVDTAGILSADGRFTLTDAVGGVRGTLSFGTKARLLGPVAGDFDRDGDDEVGGIDAYGRFGFVDDIDIPGGNPGDLIVTGTNPCLDLFGPDDIGFVWAPGDGLIGVTLDPAVGVLNLYDASPIGECDYTNGVIIEIIP